MHPTIILFHRMSLVHIYGALSPYLAETYNVIHIAYSAKEAEVLKSKYDISADYIFVDEIKSLLEERELESSLIARLDDDYTQWTDGRFCLNSAIISDRGFVHLDYHESMHLAQSYYLFWLDQLKNKENFILFHETTSLLFNHICSMQCKKFNGIYSGFIGSKGLRGCNYRFVEFDTGRSIKLSHMYLSDAKYPDDLKEKARKFIARHRENATKLTYAKKSSLISDFAKAGYFIFRKMIVSISRCQYDKLAENTDYYMFKRIESKKYFNRMLYRFALKYKKFSSDDKYIFYPMHIEPEAVVQYWSAGKYINQISLIEQIARNLPAGYHLYVKDHVDNYGYRDLADYEKIVNIPNVKLIDPGVSGLALAEYSKGVITINGTLGFEGIMLGKPVYLLGSVYYDCFKHIININDLKTLRSLVLQEYSISDVEIERLVSAYLGTAYEGDVSVFFSKRKTCHIEHEDLKNFVNVFRQYAADMFELSHEE